MEAKVAAAAAGGGETSFFLISSPLSFLVFPSVAACRFLSAPISKPGPLHPFLSLSLCSLACWRLFKAQTGGNP